jgi:hypothetical protein
VTYESPANIKSRFLINAIDNFCQYPDQPTVLVLDNAPTHRSELFLAPVEKWMKKELYVFFYRATRPT